MSAPAPSVLFIFGTRPEAIKLCPLVHALRAREPEVRVRVSVTAQHREMLDQVLAAFDVKPDHDLDLMRPNQTLAEASARMLAGLDPILEQEKPALVVVQGDTTTTLFGALSAFYRRVPVAHVEAGLRTHDLAQPFPEELNRVLAGRIATLHFAATEGAAANLRREGVEPGAITVTGNTGIDAVLHVRDGLESGRLKGREWPELDGSRKVILVTAHRRESFGEGFERICEAVLRLSEREGVTIVFPVHPNPNVRRPVERWLRGRANVVLVEPLDYVPFVDLMRRAYLMVTDSGGIQEEAPSLGKPVLVLREKTERPEAVEAGTVRLVGTDVERIVSEAGRLIDDERMYEAMSAVHNPYGDGRASARISDVICSFLTRY